MGERDILMMVVAKDPHIGLVAPHLSEEPLVMHTNAGIVEGISIRPLPDGALPAVLYNGEPVTMPGSVWLRSDPVGSIVGLLWHAFFGARWVPSPSRVMFASQTLRQVKVAEQAGLFVPRMLITSRPDDAAAFLRKVSWAIVQPLGAASMENRKRLSSRTEPDFSNVIRESVILREAPQYSHTVRVVVVGEDVFAASVSDVHPDAIKMQDVHDWRLGLARGTFLATAKKLPDRIENACRRFAAGCGLPIVVVDFIVDRSGEYVFLAADPLGDWWFLERYAGVPIGRAVGELLLAND